MRTSAAILLALCGCTDQAPTPPAADAGTDPGPVPDAAVDPPPARALGTVTAVQDLPTCPRGAPAGSSCQQVQVIGCPEIETETITATIATLAPAGAVRGTVVHFKGGGGQDWETIGTTELRDAGFRQVYVSWLTDWEQTASLGIKVAACRPATVMRWIFDGVHGGSRDVGFCAQGKSGGAGQVGYALSHYGQGDILDYVNELAGPPFTRIDLGCDGTAPPTMEVCGVPVTMRLPDKVGPWTNLPAPLTCGSTDIPASEVERLRQDSIAYGGVYRYPDTRVEFFDCTYHAPAVTAMARLLYDELAQADPDPARAAYHCYSEADGCSGEGLGAGVAVAIDAMIDGCIPNHR